MRVMLLIYNSIQYNGLHLKVIDLMYVTGNILIFNISPEIWMRTRC